MDRCFLGNHSFVICSSLQDQRFLEASNWMFSFCSEISNSILALTSATLSFYLYISQYKGFRLKLISKILKLKQYTHQLICFLPSLNITKTTGLINLVIYCYRSFLSLQTGCNISQLLSGVQLISTDMP